MALSRARRALSPTDRFREVHTLRDALVTSRGGRVGNYGGRFCAADSLRPANETPLLSRANRDMHLRGENWCVP